MFFTEMTDVCVVILIPTFVKNAPHTFLLGKKPAVEARHLFEVSTSADEQQSKHHNAIERVHCKNKIKMNTKKP